MMRWRLAIWFAAVMVSPLTSPAQQVQPGALGFVLDRGISRVRPLWGVPGAAMLGEPLDFGGDIAFSVASPRQDYVLLLSGDNRRAAISQNGIQSPLDTSDGADRIVISPEGSSAAFYYSSTGRVRVMTGLPSAVARTFDAQLSALMNPAGLFAVSDDGALLLVSETGAAATSTATSVVVFDATGVTSRIALSSPASALAFIGRSHDAVLSSASESILIRDAARQANRIALPALANGAVGIVVSPDGERVVLAHSPAGTVSILSLKSTSFVTLDCACVPTGVYRTSHGSVYRLTEYSGTAISLLDISPTQPHLLLIPPIAIPDTQ